jgi:hydrogenase nickel incorporation protein HypA/HybF
MHEAGLMKDLLRRMLEIAQQRRAKRIVGVSIWLGALSHMSPQHFSEHFAAVSAGTIAENARINATASRDEGHPNAQDVLLESIDVED